LRLVAGLAESDAAAVLGTSRATYRLAVARALPHHADGRPDVESWRMLAQAAQELQKGIPPDAAAQATDAGRHGPATARSDATSRAGTGAGTRLALWLVALLTLAAFAA